MKKNNLLISSALTLQIAEECKIKDNSDLIRLNMLCMELAANDHTVESLKQTLSYRTTMYDLFFSDEQLQKFINYSTDKKEYFNVKANRTSNS